MKGSVDAVLAVIAVGEIMMSLSVANKVRAMVVVVLGFPAVCRRGTEATGLISVTLSSELSKMGVGNQMEK